MSIFDTLAHQKNRERKTAQLQQELRPYSTYRNTMDQHEATTARTTIDALMTPLTLSIGALDYIVNQINGASRNTDIDGWMRGAVREDIAKLEIILVLLRQSIGERESQATGQLS